MTDNLYSFSLGSLPFIEGGRSRSISAENRTGEKGKGGMAAGPLGPSRKGAPAIIGIQNGATATLASIKGPGIIRHIWMTVSDEKDQGFFMLSDIVLRMYWDDEENPSVEVPLGDFFLNGFSTYQRVCSAPITVNPAKGFNSFFQMPFAKSARITIENQHPGPIGAFFYQIDYTEYDELPPSSYFHAQYRRERLTEPKVDYTILDGVEGRGHFVGLYMAHTALERYWYGEGEMKFFIDGDKDYPTICGTGLEDYFGGAFGFVEDQRKETPAHETLYQTPYQGFHFFSASEQDFSWRFEGACPPMRSFYRFHILDPIFFSKDLRITMQQIGMSNEWHFERQDDISTVAYWYQGEPHAPFPELPDRKYREPR